MTDTLAYTELSDEALVQLLSTQEDRVPCEAADEIVRRGVPVGARLAGLLDDDALWKDVDGRWWALVHAFYLLARMQPPGALDVLLRALERAERSGLDWITRDSSMLLASFGPSALPRLRETVLDARLDLWTRIWALRAVGRIGRVHGEVREEALAFLRCLGREAQASDLRTTVGDELLFFALPEDRELIESLAGDFLYVEADVEEVYSGTASRRDWGEVDWMEFYAAEAIARRQARRQAEDERRRERAAAPTSGFPPPEESAGDAPFEAPPPSPWNEAPPPPLRAEPKVGRNEPCPCGSGKKYKKCCAS